jgi:hypothetical protein
VAGKCRQRAFTVKSRTVSSKFPFYLTEPGCTPGRALIGGLLRERTGCVNLSAGHFIEKDAVVDPG